MPRPAGRPGGRADPEQIEFRKVFVQLALRKKNGFVRRARAGRRGRTRTVAAASERIGARPSRSAGRVRLPKGGTITANDILIACVDVDYRPSVSVAAGVWFRGWGAPGGERHEVAFLPKAADYVPGAFYRRELPCLMDVLARGPKADVVVVDGYVWLADGAPGLGARLNEALGGTVVGVAKTRFAGASGAVDVCRGSSRVPLYVSAVGMPVEEAAANVAAMHGPYRVPTLLKRVDILARNARPGYPVPLAAGPSGPDLRDAEGPVEESEAGP